MWHAVFIHDMPHPYVTRLICVHATDLQEIGSVYTNEVCHIWVGHVMYTMRRAVGIWSNAVFIHETPHSCVTRFIRVHTISSCNQHLIQRRIYTWNAPLMCDSFHSCAHYQSPVAISIWSHAVLRYWEIHEKRLAKETYKHEKRPVQRRIDTAPSGRCHTRDRTWYWEIHEKRLAKETYKHEKRPVKETCKRDLT